MSLNLFSHQISFQISHSPRGPPLGTLRSGVKAGIAKCHFARKQRESRAFTDIFGVFPPRMECRLKMHKEGDAIDQKRKNRTNHRQTP